MGCQNDFSLLNSFENLTLEIEFHNEDIMLGEPELSDGQKFLPTFFEKGGKGSVVKKMAGNIFQACNLRSI